jgi:hypothetical protein
MNDGPQYITPKGFKRSAKNPTKKKSEKLLPQKILPGEGILMREGRGISKEAAKLIAEAIKGMLKQ